MKSNIFMKIDDFARRHLLLTSFACLILLSFILIYYVCYVLDYGPLHEVKIGKRLIDEFCPTIWTTLFFSPIPTFAIAILLSHFLKKKTYIATPHYYKRFFLSFAPTLAIILFLLIITLEPKTFYNKIPYPYHMAILTSFVYSVIFSAFFAWLSKASKRQIMIQSSIIGILMGLINQMIGIFGTSPYM